MPRKLRHPKARHNAVQVSAATRAYLTWNSYTLARAMTGAETDEQLAGIYFFVNQAIALWDEVADDAVADVAAHYPGCRPVNWWRFSAPDLRLLIGGSYTRIAGLHRCHDTGIPYIGNGWTADPPLVESVPAYLDRLNLWLPGERERVAAAAFKARPFSYDLTIGPRVPEDVYPGDGEERNHAA